MSFLPGVAKKYDDPEASRLAARRAKADNWINFLCAMAFIVGIVAHLRLTVDL